MFPCGFFKHPECYVHPPPTNPYCTLNHPPSSFSLSFLGTVSYHLYTAVPLPYLPIPSGPSLISQILQVTQPEDLYKYVVSPKDVFYAIDLEFFSVFFFVYVCCA